MSSRIVTDLSLWPIAVFVFPPKFSDSEWEAHRDAVVALVQRREPFVTIVDTRAGGRPTQRQRADVDRTIQQNRGDFEEYLKGSAVVDSRLFARSVMTTLLWMKVPAYPVKAFASLEEAIEWGRQLLEQQPNR